jgi:hypothetical protein
MTTQQFQDDDLVYVNPDTREVISKVEWDAKEQPKSLKYVQKEEGKKSWRKFFPWGTYRSMKHEFRLEGKRKDEEDGTTLEETLPKFLNDTL